MRLRDSWAIPAIFWLQMEAMWATIRRVAIRFSRQLVQHHIRHGQGEGVSLTCEVQVYNTLVKLLHHRTQQSLVLVILCTLFNVACTSGSNSFNMGDDEGCPVRFGLRQQTPQKVNKKLRNYGLVWLGQTSITIYELVEECGGFHHNRRRP